MYQFIKTQYQLGRIDEAKVRSYVPRYLTEAEYTKLTGLAY